MTYYRVSIQGTLGSSERWSVNPCFATSFPGTPKVPALQAAATAIAAVDLPTTLGVAKSTAARITLIRVEARSDTHTLELAAEAAYTGNQGTGATPAGPAQTSAVISLRTDAPGASGRGRLYWPALGLPPMASTLRMNPADQNGLVTGAVTYLRAVQDALKAGISPAPAATTFDLAVFSRTKGTHNLVNRIMVGDVFDTQRRRRDALREAYLTKSFPS